MSGATHEGRPDLDALARWMDAQGIGAGQLVAGWPLTGFGRSLRLATQAAESAR